jgi:hypothetical protein
MRISIQHSIQEVSRRDQRFSVSFLFAGAMFVMTVSHDEPCCKQTRI